MGLGSKPDQELDPKYEWQENAASFVLRVHIPGFRKEDFRVQVDGAGRLTVRGQRGDGGNKHILRFHKVFQLPSTSNLDDISGRFDAGVLSLTVPKRPADTKPKMEDKDEAIKKHKEEKKAEQHKEEKKEASETNKAEQRMEDSVKKPIKEAAADAKKIKEEVEAKKKATADAKMREEIEAKKKAAADAEKIKEEAEAKRSKAEQVQKMATVKEESVLERVRRRAEEERSRAKAAEEAEQEQKKPSCWKEELQGLTKSQWAEGVLDKVKKNKEVIAAAVAAFSIGLFVSSRLFSRN
ncbi:hypothetical protein PR202_gb02292 [Eleusine coracana subsp. coracana]|uniref:SHSP domain-containing protein n=1 Tax=Eleusine coracana subsp. coracana TaxID=191504 RepID=A0AAV5DY28_ELECO|nr:hypothetical protein PR202_gb02292 [Eleusine coracana subsp. coracana]